MLVDFGRERLGGVLAAAGVTLATGESLPEHTPVGEVRDFLTQVGLPCEAPLMRFDLGGELTWEEGELGIGVFTFRPDVYRIVLHCWTGQVYVRHGRERQLLASDLSSLVHLCELVALLDPHEGPYARRDIECGPDTVAGLQRTMLELVGDTDPALLDTAEDISPYWRAAMTIRPLAWIAGPGDDGLTFDLSYGQLDDEFEADEILRYGDDVLPALLTHEPTRRFLRTHGLALETGPFYPARIPEPWSDAGEGHGVPPRADRMIDLGGIVEDSGLLLEGDTGRLYGWHVDSVLMPLNTDVSALAFTLWALPQIRALDAVHHFTDDHPTAAATFEQLLASVDPFAVPGPADGEGAQPHSGRHVWPQFVDDVLMEAIRGGWTTADDRPMRVEYGSRSAEAAFGGEGTTAEGTTAEGTTHEEAMDERATGEGTVRAGAVPAGIRHEASRAFLTDVGLPRRAPLLRFDLGLEEVADGLFRLGHLTYGHGQRDLPVVLDGWTGAVRIGEYRGTGRAEFRGRELLASDLSCLAHLTEAVTRLRPDTGPYARDRVGCGPQTVERLQEAMLHVVRDTDPRMLQLDEGVAGFWRHAMLIRPLAWIAGPGPDGLALDLRADVIRAELTRRHQYVEPFDETELPGALTHAATRRYLRETGLANGGSAFIELEGGPLPTVADLYDNAVDDPVAPYSHDYGYVTDGDDYPRPPGAEHLIRLAVLGDDGAMLLEGATGRVYERFMPDGVEAAMNVDVSAYNFTVWMRERVVRLSRERRLGGSYAMLSATVLDTLASVDPRACVPVEGEEGYWPTFLSDQSVSPLEH
ncbi:SUKH-4 family immunity protein [Streptomyces sp. NPDC048442]|uniref:SUKH-4 family immunity protein n=1 Tax=Streptomyces sp. NPDC048442 TaxID=3154823 RepID=UPI00343AED8D